MFPVPLNILLVEHDPNAIERVRALLQEIPDWRIDLDAVPSSTGINKALAGKGYHLCLMDREIARESTLSGVSVKKDLPVILLTDSEGRSVYGTENVDILEKSQLDARELRRAIHYALKVKRLEAELRESEGRYRALFDSNPLPMWVFDAETLLFLAVNDAAVEHYGFSREEFLNMTILDVCLLEDTPKLMGFLRAVFRVTGPEGVWRHCKKDGSRIWCEMGVHNLQYGGRPARFVVIHDLTQRHETEQALRQKEAQLQLAVQSSNTGLWDWNFRTNEVYYSPIWKRQLGYADAEIPNHYREWEDRLHPEDAPRVRRQIETQVKKATPHFEMEYRMRHRDGSYRWILSQATLYTDADGKPERLAGSHIDITPRKEHEEMVRESAERFRQMTDAMREVFWLVDVSTNKIDYISPAYEIVTGRTCESLYADPAGWVNMVHPEDREKVQKAFLDDSPNGIAIEYRIVKPDGAERWIRGRYIPIRDETGKVVRKCGAAEDITDQKRLEVQFQQAQKMEAVGRLAGGIAHDFNNLLTVINGYSQVILSTLAADDRNREPMQAIQDAGERAASLTRQLLAFSRQQVIRPEVVDLNSVIANMKGLLQRLIGEDVAIQCMLTEGEARIKADVGQVEQVVMNLAVNARDAMPRGGRLTITTSHLEVGSNQGPPIPEVPPGRYVMLSVADTGCGMDADVRARLFEPFFTTKEPGQGTGLGLATVYGIVKQSEGFIQVQSEPGHGTTFHILFPRVDHEVPASAKDAWSRSDWPRGTETILLVEDQDQVRVMARDVLQAVGYQVLVAATPDEALRVCWDHFGTIDLLLTDVVMPGMGGRELLQKVSEIRASIKVLYMSGYTDDSIVRHGVLTAEVHFLQKPFSPLALARKVREVLDSSEVLRLGTDAVLRVQP